MAFTEFDGELDDELPGYVEFTGELDKPESTLDKVKSVVSKGVDLGLSALTPKKSIAEQAEEKSKSEPNLAPVQGVPIRRDFYNKTVAETKEGKTDSGTGIVSRV